MTWDDWLLFAMVSIGSTAIAVKWWRDVRDMTRRGRGGE